MQHHAKARLHVSRKRSPSDSLGSAVGDVADTATHALGGTVDGVGCALDDECAEAVVPALSPPASSPANPSSPVTPSAIVEAAPIPVVTLPVAQSSPTAASPPSGEGTEPADADTEPADGTPESAGKPASDIDVVPQLVAPGLPSQASGDLLDSENQISSDSDVSVPQVMVPDTSASLDAPNEAESEGTSSTNVGSPAIGEVQGFPSAESSGQAPSPGADTGLVGSPVSVDAPPEDGGATMSTSGQKTAATPAGSPAVEPAAANNVATIARVDSVMWGDSIGIPANPMTEANGQALAVPVATVTDQAGVPIMEAVKSQANGQPIFNSVALITDARGSSEWVAVTTAANGASSTATLGTAQLVSPSTPTGRTSGPAISIAEGTSAGTTSGLTAALIAGIVVGCLLIMALIVAMSWVLRRGRVQIDVASPVMSQRAVTAASIGPYPTAFRRLSDGSIGEYTGEAHVVPVPGSLRACAALRMSHTAGTEALRDPTSQRGSVLGTVIGRLRLSEPSSDGMRSLLRQNPFDGLLYIADSRLHCDDLSSVVFDPFADARRSSLMTSESLSSSVNADTGDADAMGRRRRTSSESNHTEEHRICESEAEYFTGLDGDESESSCSGSMGHMAYVDSRFSISLVSTRDSEDTRVSRLTLSAFPAPSIRIAATSIASAQTCRSDVTDLSVTPYDQAGSRPWSLTSNATLLCPMSAPQDDSETLLSTVRSPEELSYGRDEPMALAASRLGVRPSSESI